jgi:hypothetical protein
MNVYFIIYYFMFLIWQILYTIGLLDLVWIDGEQIKNKWMKVLLCIVYPFAIYVSENIYNFYFPNITSANHFPVNYFFLLLVGWD